MRTKPSSRSKLPARKGGYTQLERHVQAYRQYLLDRGNAAGYVRSCEAAVMHLSMWMRQANRRLADVDEALVVEFLDGHPPKRPGKWEWPSARVGPASAAYTRAAHTTYDRVWRGRPKPSPVATSTSMHRPSRLALYAVVVTAVAAATSCTNARSDWRTASREPVGLAPDPADVKEAVVQVYGARTVGAKGLFGVHTWVAVKPAQAQEWTVYEVVGWRLRWSPSAVVVQSRAPDARWFGAEPELYADRRGHEVDELIERIDQAARAYPYGAEYRAWPGPNSNTFTAWIARAVPELELDLPATAIGKDYLGSSIFGAAPSGSGIQLSLGGVLGLAVSAVDGLEFNVLGLNFGISPNGLKLPMVGRVGLDSRTINGVEPSRSNSLVSGASL